MLIPLSAVEEIARLSFRQAAGPWLPDKVVEQSILHLFCIEIHDRFGFSPAHEEIDVRWLEGVTDPRIVEARWRKPVSNLVVVMGKTWRMQEDIWSPHRPIAAAVAGSDSSSTTLHCQGWDTELQAWSYDHPALTRGRRPR